MLTADVYICIYVMNHPSLLHPIVSANMALTPWPEFYPPIILNLNRHLCSLHPSYKFLRFSFCFLGYTAYLLRTTSHSSISLPAYLLLTCAPYIHTSTHPHMCSEMHPSPST